MVLGADADELQARADLSGARVLVHPGWADGMASSLAAGLASLAGDCEAVIVVLGDGPGLEHEAVRRVAARIALGDAPLVGARYASGRGHPTAIHRSLWSRLPQAGEDGARALGVPRVDVDCSDLRPPGDADTPGRAGRPRWARLTRPSASVSRATCARAPTASGSARSTSSTPRRASSGTSSSTTGPRPILRTSRVSTPCSCSRSG